MENRPNSGEYADYYAGYIKLVPEGKILEILQNQITKTEEFLKGISEEQAHYRYAPGKWSIKQILGHMADTERIMGYRLLCIARGETESLPAFDQDAYVMNADFDTQPYSDLIENLITCRQGTLQLLIGLNEQAWHRMGFANGNGMTVRGIAYIIAGHELHHVNMIKERYLNTPH